jgi:hypothetical protein
MKALLIQQSLFHFYTRVEALVIYLYFFYFYTTITLNPLPNSPLIHAIILVIIAINPLGEFGDVVSTVFTTILLGSLSLPLVSLAVQYYA